MMITCQQKCTKTIQTVQVLVGNKCDMDESKRVVPYSKGQALADEFGIQFFETSAKSNLKVDEVGRLALMVGSCCIAVNTSGSASAIMQHGDSRSDNTVKSLLACKKPCLPQLYSSTLA